VFVPVQRGRNEAKTNNMYAVSLLTFIYLFICSLFKDGFPVTNTSLQDVEWKVYKWMTKWKGFWRKRSWPTFYGTISKFAWFGWEKSQTTQSGQPVSGPWFECGTSLIQCRRVNHSTTTFGSPHIIIWKESEREMSYDLKPQTHSHEPLVLNFKASLWYRNTSWVIRWQRSK
jgi:hypothetical protein